MKITNLIPTAGPWRRFYLNVGGFTIKRCYWNSISSEIQFPRRYNRQGHRHKVIFVHGSHVNRLRALLQSGETALPRNRRPCCLKIHFRGWSPSEEPQTWISPRLYLALLMTFFPLGVYLPTHLVLRKVMRRGTGASA